MCKTVKCPKAERGKQEYEICLGTIECHSLYIQEGGSDYYARPSS